MQRDAAHLWHLALREAVDETDPSLAPKKLDAAEAIVFHRIDGFARTS